MKAVMHTPTHRCRHITNDPVAAHGCRHCQKHFHGVQLVITWLDMHPTRTYAISHTQTACTHACTLYTTLSVDTQRHKYTHVTGRDRVREKR